MLLSFFVVVHSAAMLLYAEWGPLFRALGQLP